jgi:hypothetical protein
MGRLYSPAPRSTNREPNARFANRIANPSY